MPTGAYFYYVPTFTNVYLNPNVPHFYKSIFVPQSAPLPNVPHFYKCIFVPQCAPLLQRYICAQMCPTFTYVYLWSNVPHFPNVLHFYKCIFVPQCAPLPQCVLILQLCLYLYLYTLINHLLHNPIYFNYPIYPNQPNYLIIKVLASIRQTTFLLLRRI